MFIQKIKLQAPKSNTLGIWYLKFGFYTIFHPFRGQLTYHFMYQSANLPACLLVMYKSTLF